MSRHKTPRIPVTADRLRMITVLAAGLVTVAVNAARPKIVVGIVVDGLHQEYIDLLRGDFGQDGFNRLLNNGIVFENVDYGPGLDATAATAVLMTGASPSVNGIPSANIYDNAGRRYVSVFNDGHTLGNYTDQSLSPSSLRVTTISDEARIAGAGVSYSHAVALQPEMALVMAGHASNSAVWLNDRTANWAGSTAYPDFPASVSQRNRVSPLKSRIDTMQWTPSAASAQTNHLPDHLMRYPFRHTFGRKDGKGLDAFAQSPLANREITRLASEIVTTQQLGAHDGVTDMLNVAYTLLPYDYTKTSENRYELIDSYIKLDAQLADLFRTVDRSAGGSDNVLIYLAGTPPRTQRRREDERWKIPSGEFSTRKAISLLNLYLIAVHGNGEWVTAYADGSFYLNENLAKERNISKTDLRREAASLLKRMAGVDQAYSIDDVLDGKAPVDDPEALRRNTLASTTGDVLVQIIPGWELLDDFNYPADAARGTVGQHAATLAPAYLLIPGAEPAVVTTVVDARAIAPTVARQMHIRSPNGASKAPLHVTMRK